MRVEPRHELTFALCDETTDALLRLASERMQARTERTILDQYYLKPVAVHQKKTTEGSRLSDRQYRVRRVNGSQDVFLQCRKWNNDVVCLKQTKVPTDTLSRINSTSVDKSCCGHWFEKKIARHKLQPSLNIRFDSSVLQTLSEGSSEQLTVDRAIRVSRQPGDQEIGLGTNIVRMTFDTSLPAIFKGLIYHFALLPEPRTVLVDLANVLAADIPELFSDDFASNAREASCQYS